MERHREIIVQPMAEAPMPGTNPWRYFLAHSKSDPDPVIDRWVTEVTTLLETTHGSGAVLVVSGRDDFKERAGALGGWKEWLPSVATGVDWRGSPIFDGVVVPLGMVDTVVGKATTEMVDLAIAGSKPVYAYIVSDQTFWAVAATVKESGNNWISWATLSLTMTDAEPEEEMEEEPESEEEPKRKSVVSGDFTDDCRDLIQRAESLDLEAAEDFCASIIEKTESMMTWSEEHDGRATEKMTTALENMSRGLSRWEDRR